MGKSYKTTILGVIAILTAVFNGVTALINGTPVDWTMIISSISAGIGLIAAKDSQVTGGSITQPSK